MSDVDNNFTVTYQPEVAQTFVETVVDTDDTPIYQYDEDLALNQIRNYINSTYDAHYALGNDMQVFDIWESMGSLETTARDTAIKYLMRYGKKDGYNRKDLLKAIHYIIVMMYVGNQADLSEYSDEDDK